MVDGNLDGHLVGAGFDAGVCDGSHPRVSGACRFYSPDGEQPPDHCLDSMTGVIANLVSSRQCGLCCCPMATMGMLSAPPAADYESPIGTGCPRLQIHQQVG